MKQINTEMLQELLRSDRKDYFENTPFPAQSTEFCTKVEELFDSKSWQKHAVIGLDIYKYSKMSEIPQALVPIAFSLLYAETIKHVRVTEPVLFSGYDDLKFRKHFISTGDGGFQILDNPLQGVLFAMIFQKILHTFNTFHFYPNLRSAFDSLTLRYCLTYDHVYEFEDNFYGKAIITNARIMSKDKLNRFLVDESTVNWFSAKINGLESLRIMGIGDIAEKLGIILPAGGKLTTNYFHAGPASINLNQLAFIQTVITQKLAQINPKGDIFNTYNVFLQYLAGLKDESDGNKQALFVISLGNTNSADL